MAIAFDELRTRAGRLLYRQLPVEYRYQDEPMPDEFGDLESFLHGFGHLIDLMRGTIEQSYADAFAEEADNGREIQTWLLPYMADLVGADLLSPSPDVRRRELNNAVFWTKTKGSLTGVDNVADVMSGAEAVIVEGWRRTLITPRLGLPPFAAPAGAMGDGSPDGAPALPLGTPDIRYCSRAVADPNGANPLYRREIAQRGGDGLPSDPEIIYWRPLFRRGAPCFPGAYDDVSVRAPDLRDPQSGAVGPHPKRTLVHVRPPSGFFEPGVREEALAGADPLSLSTDAVPIQSFAPRQVLETLSLPAEPLPDRLHLTGDLTIPADAHVALTDIMIEGTVTLEAGARLTLDHCAIRTIVLPVREDQPTLIANDSLIGDIISLSGYAELVHVTVLGDTVLERLNASDSIFAGILNGVNCSGTDSCIRFSRVGDLEALGDCQAEKNVTNTEDDPNFVSLFFEEDDGTCVRRPAEFGEPGAGVLDLTAPASVRRGAENAGEMGAYNHQYHAASIRALKAKLNRFAPFGQEIALIYDPYLARRPAELV